jgi:hypothetical protein
VATVSFAGVGGTAPDLGGQTSVLAAQHNFFGFNDFQSNPFTNDFSFASLTLTATVRNLDIGSGTLAYTPEDYAVLSFCYDTTATSDPGSFVSLQPIPSTLVRPELLGVGITMQPNGDMTLTFLGTLQSSTNLAQGFVDVPGYPQGQYTIPKAQLKTTEHFRVRQ